MVASSRSSKDSNPEALELEKTMAKIKANLYLNFLKI
tara:strand:+ start:221 stop:331 length:111 start_codon:yes stop_codon:yes gene_type:complete